MIFVDVIGGRCLVCLPLWTHHSSFWSLQGGWLGGTTPTSSLAPWLNGKGKKETEVNSQLCPVMSPLWPSPETHYSLQGVLLDVMLSSQILAIPLSPCPSGPRSGNSPAGIHPLVTPCLVDLPLPTHSFQSKPFSNYPVSNVSFYWGPAWWRI